MTVISLWKSLQATNCGARVGEHEMKAQKGQSSIPDSWVRSNTKRPNPQSLAIDLSIWICEALTTGKGYSQSTNPALSLVFTRTMKLLMMGLKLVVVIEGKSRIIRDEEDHRFRKRNSSTAFGRACNECQHMLTLLGVPVVRAKAEGEALCALLNSRGIVDGVITNDGDCLLFGAKTIFTKFSLENLANNCVVRYDHDDLRVFVGANKWESNSTSEMTLSREDLIAFSILTGSDIVGSGLSKVGAKKALRFIGKSKADNPLAADSAAIDDMKSWSKIAQKLQCIETFDDMILDDREGGEDLAQKTKCCSCCGHAGTKRSHLKHGCEECGTEPGECCLHVTADDRFRKALRSKVIQMVPPFDPSRVVSAYLSPNSNQIPHQLVDGLVISRPNLKGLLKMKTVIKGKDVESSRGYLKIAVGRLLVHNELFQNSKSQRKDFIGMVNKGCPEPVSIETSLTHKGVPCFRVKWTIPATLTDENGDDVDGYEYTTIESKQLVEDNFPQLVEAFQDEHAKHERQGDNEKERRRQFLDDILNIQAVKKALIKAADRKAREGFFATEQTAKPVTVAVTKTASHDVSQLLRFVKSPPRENAVIKTNKANKRKTRTSVSENDIPALTSSRNTICNFGETVLKLTPMKAAKSCFPPRNIYVFQPMKKKRM